MLAFFFSSHWLLVFFQPNCLPRFFPDLRYGGCGVY